MNAPSAPVQVNLVVTRLFHPLAEIHLGDLNLVLRARQNRQRAPSLGALGKVRRTHRQLEAFESVEAHLVGQFNVFVDSGFSCLAMMLWQELMRKVKSVEETIRLGRRTAQAQVGEGPLLEELDKNETELGMLAKSFMDHGDLVPDEVTIDMLKAEVEKNTDANGFIFDGFPRTNSQAKALDSFLAEKGEGINGMVALEVAEDLLVARLLKRGETSGRSDDQDESKIRNRFNEYETKTAILKDYYKTQNKYFGVDGVGVVARNTA